MARETFLENVRDAVAMVAPAAGPDSDPLDPDGVGRALRRAATWLTPKTVEGFDPRDFADLEADRREGLKRAVATFRGVAKAVPPDAPTTLAQGRAGWSSLQEIAEALRPIVRDEWVREVDRLIEEAKGWCHEEGWLAEKKAKATKDRFLGEYEVPQLFFHTGGDRLLLDPVARYASGASGLLDLAVLPSYESVMVTRIDGRWYIHPVRGFGRRREWSKRAFVDVATRLSELA